MPKLIRNFIPEDMRSRGYEPELRIVEGEELAGFLIDKVMEEAGEVHDSDGRDLSELADLLQALRSLAIAKGLTLEQLEAARETKALRRGTFSQGIVWVNDGDGSTKAIAARSGYAKAEASRG